jgi:2',3'-cyclic-nucleotide 2'-phosphodiesterase / 3'-nucleotidase
MFGRKKGLFLVLCISVLLILGLGSCREQKPQSLTIKIVQTSDVHGAVFPYDFMNDTEHSGSLARVSSYLKQERSNPDQYVIYIDNGDILQGQPVVYFSNFIDTTEKNLISRSLNFLNADAAVVGNHDIEAGPAVYNKVVHESNFPWLAANVTSGANGKPYFNPYTTINIKGVKVSVLGMITPNVPNWLPPQLWEGMEFHEILPKAASMMKEIQKRENPEIIVGVFHDGFGSVNEYPNGEILFENASSQVAYEVPGFDLLMIGHDHQLRNSLIKNSLEEDVLVLNPGGNCRYIAVATIQLTWNPQFLKYDKEISGELIDLSEFDPDPEFMEVFAEDFRKASEFVDTPVGNLTSSISSRDAIFGPSAFTDFIHQVQLDITGAAISFTAPLSFNSIIQAGDLFVRDMFRLYRFENYLYTMELSGKEIKDYLEYSYGNWMNTMSSSGDYMLLYRKDESGNLLANREGRPMINGPSYNFDAAAGIKYTVDISKPVGQRITIQSFDDGETFSMTENYKVAINSYRGSGGGGHLEEGAGIPREEFSQRVLASTPKDFRHYLMEWIREQETVNPATYNNWKVIPEEWWTQARDREMKLLFNGQ